MIITFGTFKLKDISDIVNYAAGFGCQIINIHKDKWTCNGLLVDGYRVWINAINGKLAGDVTENIIKHFKDRVHFTAEIEEKSKNSA